MNAHQMRAARALLGWSQGELASRSGISEPTIKRMELLGPGRSSGNTIVAVRSAMEASGVRFIPEGPDGGVGVRFNEGEEPQ